MDTPLMMQQDQVRAQVLLLAMAAQLAVLLCVVEAVSGTVNCLGLLELTVWWEQRTLHLVSPHAGLERIYSSRYLHSFRGVVFLQNNRPNKHTWQITAIPAS